ncbi:MAG: nuclear transport factor 2 family protein [Polyangiaceae bacterium]
MTYRKTYRNCRQLTIALAASAIPLLLACDKTPQGKGARSSTESDPTEERTMDRDIETLKQVEQIWIRSLTTGDPKLLATIIDTDFSFIGPDGEYEESAAYLAGYEELPKMGVRVESISISDAKFRVRGETAIATGRVLAKLTMQNQLIVEDVRFTRVYRRAHEGWRMIAGQGTRIAAPLPEKVGTTNGE